LIVTINFSISFVDSAVQEGVSVEENAFNSAFYLHGRSALKSAFVNCSRFEGEYPDTVGESSGSCCDVGVLCSQTTTRMEMVIGPMAVKVLLFGGNFLL